MDDTMPPACQVRAMMAHDIAHSIALWKESPGVGLGVGDDEAGLERFLRRNPGVSHVALDGEKIIGTCLGGHDGRRGMLYHVAVSERWRRHGIGRRLVDATLAKLTTERVGKVGLLVMRDNAPGQDFWSKNGFLSREDVLYMQTRLEGACVRVVAPD